MIFLILMFGFFTFSRASSEWELDTYHSGHLNMTQWVHEVKRDKLIESVTHKQVKEENKATDVTEILNNALKQIHNNKKLLDTPKKHAKLYKKMKTNKQTIVKETHSSSGKRKKTVKVLKNRHKTHEVDSNTAHKHKQQQHGQKDHKIKIKSKTNEKLKKGAKKENKNNRKYLKHKLKKQHKIAEYPTTDRESIELKQKKISTKGPSPNDEKYILENFDEVKFISTENGRDYDTADVSVKNYWKK